jgi:hypothetical protein
MSLYREARSERRRLLLVAGVAVAGIAAIAVALVALGGEQSEADRLASLQDDVQPALAALELIPIHYESPNPRTHAAASEQLAVALDTVAQVEDDLLARDAARTGMLLQELDELDRLLGTTGELAAVERLTTKTSANLRALVGLHD